MTFGITWSQRCGAAVESNCRCRSVVNAAGTDVDRQSVAPAAIRLWKANPAPANLDAAGAVYSADPVNPRGMAGPHSWPRGFKPLTDLLPDPLILLTLANAICADATLEAALVMTRRELLARAAAEQTLNASQSWLEAIALQARNTEWVWPETEAETHELQKIEGRAALSGEQLDRSLILISAMYRPLETDQAAEPSDGSIHAAL